MPSGGPHQTFEYGSSFGASRRQLFGDLVGIHGQDGRWCKSGGISGQMSGDDLDDVQLSGIFQD